jgi:predicted metallo-beta-lactamase superfamily hydrolase
MADHKRNTVIRQVGIRDTNTTIKHNDNKKFWEEVIAYFPLIQHGPHGKRNNFVDTHRQTYRQQGNHIIHTQEAVGILSSRCLATIRELLPSRCLVTIGGIHRQAQTHTYTDSNVIS